MPSWVTSLGAALPAVIAALIAATAALMAAELLTAQTRLRRTLDKELAIHDRLPDGYAKDEFEKIVKRDALHLVHRSKKRDRYRKTRWSAWLLAGSVFVVVAIWLVIVESGDEAGPYIAATALILFIAAAYFSSARLRRARRKFVKKHMKDPPASSTE